MIRIVGRQNSSIGLDLSSKMLDIKFEGMFRVEHVILIKSISLYLILSFSDIYFPFDTRKQRVYLIYINRNRMYVFVRGIYVKNVKKIFSLSPKSLRRLNIQSIFLVDDTHCDEHFILQTNWCFRWWRETLVACWHSNA